MKTKDFIVEQLKQQINDFQSEVKIEHVGTVVEVGDGIARISGLSEVMSSEMLAFETSAKEVIYGVALNLEEDTVGAIILGDYLKIKEGDTVKCTQRILQVPVGEAVVGRVVNPLGQALDGKGEIKSDKFYPVEKIAPGVITRESVKVPVQTGIKAIDAMIPIGRGQRELIIGDRQTGKTALVVDTILNQKEENVICIYVAIGQKSSTIASIIDTLQKYGAMKYTTIVSASASEPAPLLYIAPFAGCTMGEYFRDRGQHALIIYDDLSKHAVAYRQLSLLLRRPPGREAYPGDIFNLHSRLLERAAKCSDKLGGGSLTALPIIETKAGDVTDYISTNVISITDGQIYLEPDLFYAGVKPAINVGLSVSRVGGAAQTPAMKRVAGRSKLDLAQYRELVTFAQFASDLDKTTQAQLTRGERLVEILKQPQFASVPMQDQVIILWVGTNGFLDDLALGKIKPFMTELLAHLQEQHPRVREDIKKSKKLEDKDIEIIRQAVTEFKAVFVKS